MTIDTKVLSQRAGDRSLKRIQSLLEAEPGISQAEVVEILNEEGYLTLRLKKWTTVSLRQVIFKLRHQLKSFYGLSARRAGLVIDQLPEATA